MVSPHLLWVFIGALAVVYALPGPDMALVLQTSGDARFPARTRHGRRSRHGARDARDAVGARRRRALAQRAVALRRRAHRGRSVSLLRGDPDFPLARIRASTRRPGKPHPRCARPTRKAC